MRMIYPFNPLNEREADDPYQEEYAFLRSRGVACSLFNFDTLDLSQFRPKPAIVSGETVLYRGWMLNPERYQRLASLIEEKGGSLLTTYQAYVRCHHLPNWYEACQAYTAESRFFSYDDELVSHVSALGWSQYFVKDFVKSNSTQRGSIASSPEEVKEIADLIHHYRGGLEGGVAVRRVESYRVETEQRYFVFHGKVYGPIGDAPSIVHEIATHVDAPFYSVDVVQRDDGVYRLVELGDGQVSDKKGWDSETFSNMLLENVS